MRFLRAFIVCIYAQIYLVNLTVSSQIKIPIRCPYSNIIQQATVGSASVAASSILDAVLPENGNYISKEPVSYAIDGGVLNNFYPLNRTDRFACNVAPRSCIANKINQSYRSYDGSCNNLRYPGYGMAVTRYSRLLPPKYSDRVYSPTVSVTGAPLPNARLISLNLFGEETYPDSLRTLAFMQWGQLVSHDISQLSRQGAPNDCCNQVDNKRCYPIYLPSYGPIAKQGGKSCLNFARATSDADVVCPASGLPYSEKLSMQTAYIDLSTIYGNSPSESQKTRAFKGGKLRTAFYNGRHWLPTSDNINGECGEGNHKCYAIPDERNQFTPTVTVLQTLLQREHNRIAGHLAAYNPSYSDERIFQEARKINIAQFQKLTYYDWLPLALGSQYAYDHNLIYSNQPYDYVNDYDPSIDPSPFAEYAGAAFRYAHNLVPGWFSLVTSSRYNNQTIRLSEFAGRSEIMDLLSERDNFDALARGMATQTQKRSDGSIDREIKHYFERKLYEEFGSDLKSIDIQRGRDFGLPSYNDLRQFCGLPRAYQWSDFSDLISPQTIATLQKIYPTIDDVDLGVGGSFEKHLPNSIFGPTFQCIIGRQFLKLRKGDRFFFENAAPYTGFNPEQLAEIRKVSPGGLFCANGDNLQQMQSNIFVVPNARNPLQNCLSFPQINFSKWKGF